MEWKKFTIKTRSAAEDVITAILADLDIYSVEIEDNVPLTETEKAQMFVDIAPERKDDGTAFISFYLEEDADAESVVEKLENAILAYRARMDDPFYIDPGECTITSSVTEDQDWINNWKQYFSSFYIDDILFIPSWEKEAQTAKDASLVIHIDPGIAFGTGKHETTQLCIRELREKVKPGMKVLDVGTGSGILAMLAFKFGAASVFATDLDVAVNDACRDNFERNGLKDADFKLVVGNLIDDKAVQDAAGYDEYDIVVANILAPVLIMLMPAVYAALRPGGVFITSGIIEGKEEEVAGAMSDAGFKDICIRELGEWRMVSAVKQDGER